MNPVWKTTALQHSVVFVTLRSSLALLYRPILLNSLASCRNRQLPFTQFLALRSYFLPSRPPPDSQAMDDPSFLVRLAHSFRRSIAELSVQPFSRSFKIVWTADIYRSHPKKKRAAKYFIRRASAIPRSTTIVFVMYVALHWLLRCFLLISCAALLHIRHPGGTNVTTRLLLRTRGIFKWAHTMPLFRATS